MTSSLSDQQAGASPPYWSEYWAPPANPLTLRRIAAKLAQDITTMGVLPTIGHGLTLTESDLWHDLAACILGSQVRHSQMRGALRNLAAAGLGEPWKHPEGATVLTADFARALSGTQNDGSARSGYRFPQRGATLLAGAVQAIYGVGDSLSQIVRSTDVNRLRRELVERVPGLGPKQASLFLIGIGLSRDIAALDRHVLRFIALTSNRTTDLHSARGVGAGRISTYERFESALRVDAAGVGVCLASFDLAVWVLMRTWSGLWGRESVAARGTI